MQSAESRAFAQFGGFLLLVSLALPYFTFQMATLLSMNQRLWTIDKGAFVLIAAYGLLALTQVRFSPSRETVALIYMIVAGLVTAAIIYRVWISPPLGGLDIKYGGVSLSDVLKQAGFEWKVGYGAYVAMLGSAFFLVGSFLEWRSAPSGEAAPPQVYNPQQQFQGQQQYGQQQYGQQTYAQPEAQQTYAQPAAPPDPFAPPAAPTQPTAAPPPQPPEPPAPPQAPQRPPGS